MLITLAPFSTAHRIAFATASTGMMRLPVTTFATRSSADGARPAMPILLSSPAAMIPETKAYLDKRRAGEVAKLSSWREFLRSYPAMRRGESAGPAGS